MATSVDLAAKCINNIRILVLDPTCQLVPALRFVAHLSDVVVPSEQLFFGSITAPHTLVCEMFGTSLLQRQTCRVREWVRVR